jgi:hypothetical protein
MAQAASAFILRGAPPKSAVADLGAYLPISGKLEIGGARLRMTDLDQSHRDVLW